MNHYKRRMAEITGVPETEEKSVPKAAPDAPKDFYEGLCEEYVVMSGRYQGEINRLRAQVRRLQAQIDSTPAALTEMQDRITLLESILASRP